MEILFRSIRRFILDAVLFLWGLPQELVGLGVFLVLKARDRDAVIYSYNPEHAPGKGITAFVLVTGSGWGGFSLGRHIVICREMLAFCQIDVHGQITVSNRYISHEYGHTLQSAILGPAYFIVARYSISWAAWYILKGRKGDYYSYWSEAWADDLGGVRK